MGRADERAERAEQEAQQRQIEEQRRERVAEMTPAPRVLRTPREEVEAYILDAGAELRGETVNVAGALRELDRALRVLREESVVDGAALLTARIEQALDMAREGMMPDGPLEEALELLRRRVRYPDVEIPVSREDFALTTDGHRCKRDAVRAVLKRHELRAWAALGVEVLDDEVIDELIAAAETGI